MSNLIDKQEAIDAIELYRRNMEHILGPEDERVKVIERCIHLVEDINSEVSLDDYLCGGKK